MGKLRQLIRENPTLVFGLGFPLLLVLLLGIASAIPQWFIEPPRYEVIYAYGYSHYDNHPGWRVQVVNGKAHVTFASGEYYSNTQRLWRYNPQTGTVKEIPVVVPPELIKTNDKQGNAPRTVTPLAVPELETLKLNTSNRAPDGYEFRMSEQYRQGFIFDIMFSPYSSARPMLVKNGRSVRIPVTDTGRYYYSPYDTQFIGWVVP